MHKIKKGIKKKIKGKKDKDDELFTPEELERYKKEKEEQARREAEKHLEQECGQEESEEQQEDKTDTPQETGPAAASDATAAPSVAAEGNWRDFLAATDTVLKKTTDNLVHIKEVSSVVQKEKPTTPVPAEAPVVTQAAAAATAAPSKKWVDLEKGGIDDAEPVDSEETESKPEPEPEFEPAPLHFIEDLPEVDVDEFTEVFDTTYVDNVESGEVKLHYIPESPTEQDPNEPDPFDTSVVDKVLHAEEEKLKKVENKTRETKKKKQLVSLGCAVEVLTGNIPVEKTVVTPPTSSKRRRVVSKEKNLLGDFGDESDQTGEVGGESDQNIEKTVETDESKETKILDDIFCVGELEADLPEPGTFICPSPRALSPTPNEEKIEGASSVILNNGCESKEIDLSEFLESSGEEQDNNKDTGKDVDLKELVAEFDIIDKAEVADETLVSNEPDPIEDEFDAEFAFLAAESVAKAKEKEFEELEDDPFDTTVAAQVLGEDETNQSEEYLGDSTQESRSNKVPPPRPAPPKDTKEPWDQIDPFDTSLAEKHLPADPFSLSESEAELPETLLPQQGTELKTSESFDPFDTSIAESFGKTELKVLETELLSTYGTEHSSSLKKSDSDFDFDPRAEEVSDSATSTCLLTGTEGDSDPKAPVLAPTQKRESEDFDPFDTSIAAKVEIQTLEAELLCQPDRIQLIGEKATESKKAPPPRPPTAQARILATTPTDVNPTLQSSAEANIISDTEDFDPFDTSIADKLGSTEIKSTEGGLLADQQQTKESIESSVKSKVKELQLPIKPLRPPSPKCLLTTTPLDEQPFVPLQPQVGIATNRQENLPDEFDPFDTSIADQFGNTELKVLENQLLVSQELSEDQDFDSRESKEKPPRPDPPRSSSSPPSRPVSRPPSRPPSRPLSPAKCLLTASPTRTPVSGEILLPSNPLPAYPNEEVDPFDTSIAEKFGKTELRHLESELLTPGVVSPAESDDFDPRKEDSPRPPASPKPPRPERPVQPNPCLLATTPVDGRLPLQPCLNPVAQSLEGVTPEDIDPFDTSIANKLCKTEIKHLEESFLPRQTQESNKKNILSTAVPECASVDRILSSSPTSDLGPTLQPVSDKPLQTTEEFDPFDTSIADKFGKTELKTLESELLSDAGIKRNLSDDEFDPREEETKTPKRPPPPRPQSPAPVNLLDSTDDFDIPDPLIQAIQPQPAIKNNEDYDPFDTSIAADIAPSKVELKFLESELLSSQDPFDTSNIA